MKTFEKVATYSEFVYEKAFLHLYSDVDCVINIIEEKENKVILPFIDGKTLYEIPLPKRQEIFLNLLHSFKYKKTNEVYFPTLKDWLTNTYNKKHSKKVIFHLENCIKYYDIFKINYPDNKIIHGDLHFHNIMLSPEPIIIDPHGVWANPICEFSRMILNEIWENPINWQNIYEDYFNKINKLFKYPKSDLLFCLYLDTTISLAWTEEDNKLDNISLELLENLAPLINL